jgi:hypothetical protein
LRHGSPEKIFDAEQEYQATFVRIASKMSKSCDVDVLVINLLLLDHANHKMPDMVAVKKAICKTDSDIDQLISGFEPDNVMLFSGHG